MDYEIHWEGDWGYYARFTGWLTPESAARVAIELAMDRRYYNLRYAIIDFTDCPGHTFRRDDRQAVVNAMVQAIGASMANSELLEIAIAKDPRMLNFLHTYESLTTRPFHIFATIEEARWWLEERLGHRNRHGPETNK